MSGAGKISRRDFLTTLAGVGVAASAPKSWAADKASDLKSFFDDAKLTDQYGQEFKPSVLFADKPVIFIFGFNHCSLCEGDKGPGIVDSVAALQQELLRQKKDIPIVLVDVIPGIDKGDPREHVATHYEHGMRQFAAEPVVNTAEAGKKAFDDGKQKDMAGRLFHIAYAPNEKWVEELQTSKMKLLQDPNDPYNHALDAVLFVKGKQQKHMLLIPAGNELAKFQDHGKKLAEKIISEIGKARQ